jgi:hypothetical protein
VSYLEEGANKLLPAEGDFMDDAAKAMYAVIVRQAVGDLCHAAFRYKCKDCGFDWWVWMGLGIEGPGDLHQKRLALPCPFIIQCPAWPDMKPCRGEMNHVDWDEDQRFTAPVLPPDDVPRFILPESGGDCGHLHIPTPALVKARRAMNEEGGRRPPTPLDNNPSA